MDRIRARFATGGAVALLALLLSVPLLRDLFRFSKLHADDVVISLAAGVFSTLWFELFKLPGRNAKQKRISVQVP